MKIIISHAKKIKEDTDSLEWKGLPCFLDRTEEILAALKQLTNIQRQKLWACNDQIAELNNRRLERMNLRRRLTPAFLCYEGIQYQRMGPGVFNGEQLEYGKEHLRILSGFYGILGPMDGVTPYRLEMQARLQVGQAKNLYDFWGDSLAKALEDTDWILNLASKEYSVAVSRYLDKTLPFITCVFGEEKAGKVVEKATLCKMARGEMVRYMAEHQVRGPEQLFGFDRLGFRYSPEKSDGSTLVFIRQPGYKE